MERNPTWLAVVAAAIRDGEGRLLLQRRLDGKHHGGLWEFPGGKVEMHENPRFALAREISEELAIELDPVAMEPLGFAEETGQAGRPGVVLLLYSCPGWSGLPESLEGQQFGWFLTNEAEHLPLAPMDRRLLHGIAG